MYLAWWRLINIGLFDLRTLHFYVWRAFTVLFCAQHLSSRRQIHVVCADITRSCSVEIVDHCVLDTDDITKRWIETGSVFPNPTLFQFRKGICYGDHFPVANLQYQETFRQVTFDIWKYIGLFLVQLLIFAIAVNYFARCGFYHAGYVIYESKYESRLSARRRTRHHGGERMFKR